MRGRVGRTAGVGTVKSEIRTNLADLGYRIQWPWTNRADRPTATSGSVTGFAESTAHFEQHYHRSS
ncbi:hypothetical protein PGT21_034217 [Puccinia graminis f. sp. tritici]|uniref:Uncharacterized protein n=1 Tax=Puccinia graminis f. sp. tritici TaxID=56615 RepID=A0A5B0PMQ0_PUCGR|nr:hypothetical protein PGT21_034217 [Puccinia graminis f. sp. tritici]KAA1133829.1 hypothetical protein PGTUg99_023346 [Puccinia graminis f. sp. tritici]